MNQTEIVDCILRHLGKSGADDLERLLPMIDEIVQRTKGAGDSTMDKSNGFRYYWDCNAGGPRQWIVEAATQEEQPAEVDKGMEVLPMYCPRCLSELRHKSLLIPDWMGLKERRCPNCLKAWGAEQPNAGRNYGVVT